MKLVDKHVSTPLYLQLANIIEEMIENGELENGAFLMPERELCKYQDVSRMTVNKAIMKLVNEGILSRHQGKGTFITPKKEASRYERLESLSEVMAKKGITVNNDILSFGEISFTPAVVARLQMQGDVGFRIQRRRYFEEDPVILETIYLNPAMTPDLSLELLEANSLYDLFHHRYGHVMIRAEQTIKPIKLSNLQGELLSQPAGMLALEIDRVVYTDKEEILEYTKTVFLTQKHEFEVVFNR